MATKKQTEIPVTNHNVNTNNNTNNVNVKVEFPKERPGSNKNDKPNWIVKAIVIGLIGIGLSVLSYLVMNAVDGNSKSDQSIQLP